MEYNFKEIEQKWRQHWSENQTNKTEGNFDQSDTSPSNSSNLKTYHSISATIRPISVFCVLSLKSSPINPFH